MVGDALLSNQVVKRIMLELENLKDFLRGMDDGQIFVVFSESSCLLWKVLMIPSSGTPYFGGCFEFHLAIPPDYPAKPPKCQFMTTGGTQVRVSPLQMVVVCPSMALSCLSMRLSVDVSPSSSLCISCLGFCGHGHSV